MNARQGRPSIFLIISAKTGMVLYVGSAMRAAFGREASEFLGRHWDVVTQMVTEVFRREFTVAIEEFIQGHSRLSSFVTLRNTAGTTFDCELASPDLLAGKASECLVTCSIRFPKGPRQAADRSPRAVAHRAAKAPPSRLAATQWRAGLRAALLRDMARELHGGVAQDLFLCKSRLMAVRDARGAQARARSVAEAISVVETSAASLRRLLTTLAAETQVGSGLRLGLMDAARWARKNYAMDVTLRVRAGVPLLGGRADELLLASARELLVNVFKHSGQRLARVVLRPIGNGARLDVIDFGSGIRPSKRPSARRPASGLGLSGIHSQAARLGGGMEIESTPGARTRVSVQLPSGSRP